MVGFLEQPKTPGWPDRPPSDSPRRNSTLPSSRHNPALRPRCAILHRKKMERPRNPHLPRRRRHFHTLRRRIRQLQLRKRRIHNHHIPMERRRPHPHNLRPPRQLPRNAQKTQIPHRPHNTRLPHRRHPHATRPHHHLHRPPLHPPPLTPPKKTIRDRLTVPTAQTDGLFIFHISKMQQFKPIL